MCRIVFVESSLLALKSSAICYILIGLFYGVYFVIIL